MNESNSHENSIFHLFVRRTGAEPQGNAVSSATGNNMAADLHPQTHNLTRKRTPKIQDHKRSQVGGKSS